MTPTFFACAEHTSAARAGDLRRRSVLRVSRRIALITRSKHHERTRSRTISAHAPSMITDRSNGPRESSCLHPQLAPTRKHCLHGAACSENAHFSPMEQIFRSRTSRFNMYYARYYVADAHQAAMIRDYLTASAPPFLQLHTAHLDPLVAKAGRPHVRLSSH